MGRYKKIGLSQEMGLIDTLPLPRNWEMHRFNLKELCHIGYSDQTENEKHFVLNSSRYTYLRQIFTAKYVEFCESFLSLRDEQNLILF